jgi:hypothetical protein
MKDEYPGTPDNFVLWFDVSKVGALQELEKDKRQSVNELWKSGLWTREEAKIALGMKPLPADKVYYVSLATEFVPADQVVVRETQPAEKPPAANPAPPNPDDQSTDGKQRKNATGGRMLQRIRLSVAKRMESAVDVYFSQLSDRVTERAGKSLTPSKKLPSASNLITNDDKKKLEELIKRFYIEIIQLSWSTWNYTLGVELAFDLTDPIVTEALRNAATQVKEITETTMEEIRGALEYGNEQGWSVDQLVRGDEAQRGLRDIVDETYKDRARVIARTELGEAQNNATVARYKDAGVGLVEILDNGSTDDDEECRIANGQIWTLEYFAANTLEHPNCTRAAAPYFGDGKPDRG